MKSTYANRQRGSAHAVATLVVFVALFSAVGLLFVQNMVFKSSSRQDANAASIVVPDGWKKYESSQYGVSFITPKTWNMAEYGAATSGSRYVLTIGAPQYSLSTGFDITAYLGKIDDLVEAATKEYTKNTQLEVVSSTLKWNGYDARRLSISQVNNPSGGTRGQLFVQAGDYAFAIPDSEHPPTVVVDGKVTKDDWKKFIESVRIERV